MLRDDVAIIGVGVRFPADTNSTEQLWNLLSAGQSRWSEFPSSRLNIDGYFHPSGDRQGSIPFRGAHFLSENIAAFDASFFSITAEEAQAIDPQQRILLEVCYEAIENAGLKKEEIDGSNTAVYMGSFVKDYEQICLRDPDWQPKYAATGNGTAIMANRISYAFNLQGPSMTIDTGCSGSLVSVHLAAQSLRSHESSMAIAGGVGLIMTPSTIMPMTALNFLSPDGKCFTFDARANGYGRGEGAGIIIMKRLSDALRDNDPIRAVIRGSGVNQDGKTTGITMPSKEAQVANIQRVYQHAGLSFDQTGYVECHGTGTQAGDWRELKAVSETLASGRCPNNPLIVGSIKPNIGHLEGAAGVAGLIKAVLMLEYGKIPPNVNFQSGHPAIDFECWKVKVPTELLNWPNQGIRRISVNCFGFGGTNAHVIVDEAPRVDGLSTGRQRLRSLMHSPKGTKEIHFELNLNTKQSGLIPGLFCYSSHERAGVVRVIDRHVRYLLSRPPEPADKRFHDYAYTLGCRRSKLEWRLCLVADSTHDLIMQMQSASQSVIARHSSGSHRSICFLFGGQGTQWAQMGKDLMHYRQYRVSIWEASYYIKTRLGSSYDLLEELLRRKGNSRLHEPDISQPATTAVQIALIELLAGFGVRPSLLLGHSSGEIAAAFAAGALSREDAWEVAYYRGLAAATLPILAPKLRGAMIVVAMSQREAQKYLESILQSAQVACINSSHSTTISGRSSSIMYIANDLRQKNVFCKILDINIAYHSSHMKLIEPDYKALLRHITPRSFHPGMRMFSSVTGKEISGKDLNSRYWAKNLVSPVQYLAAMEAMMRQCSTSPPDVLLEISPRATLRSPTLDIMSRLAPNPSPKYHSILDAGTQETKTVLQLVGDLWCRGYQLNMEAVMSQGLPKGNSPVCLTDLPPYPWNHEKTYWHESHLDKSIRFREYPRQDLIGAPTPDSTPFERRWRGFLRVSEIPWIQDHQIQKTIVYPAAGMVSMVLEAAKQIVSNAAYAHSYEISDMDIIKAMAIPDTAHGLEVTLHVRLETLQDALLKEPGAFTIYSKPLDGSWQRHATGFLRVRRRETCDTELKFRSHAAHYEKLNESCIEALNPRQLYEQLDVVGINYGPLFRNISRVRRSGTSCVSEVRVPDTKACMPCKFEYPHVLHPATLDSMFQTLFAIKPVSMIPTFIKYLCVSADITSLKSTGFLGYATADQRGSQSAMGTLFMKQAGSDASYIYANGLRFTSIATSSSSFLPNYHNLCSEIIWKEDPSSMMPVSLGPLIEAYAHKYPGLRVLQIGRNPVLARTILDIVAPSLCTTPALSRYTIVGTDGEEPSTLVAELVKFKALEAFVEAKSISALVTVRNYHIVVLTAPSRSLSDPKEYLWPGGVLLRAENFLGQDVPFELAASPFDEAVSISDGLSSVVHEHCVSTGLRPRLTFQRTLIGNASSPVSDMRIILLRPDFGSMGFIPFVDELRKAIEIREPRIILSEMRLEDFVGKKPPLANCILISLLDLSEANCSTSSIYTWGQSDFEAFKAMYNSVSGIIWITRGANMVPHVPKASPIVALARTLMSEDSSKKMVTIDLNYVTHPSNTLFAMHVLYILRHTFHSEPGMENEIRDTEFALDADKMFIPRLRPIQALNDLIEHNSQSQLSVCSMGEYKSHGKKDSGVNLDLSKPSVSDTSFELVGFKRHKLKANEVEIVFEEAPLTRKDLEALQGRSDAEVLGLDVYGHVRDIGANVTNFRPGDRVCSLLCSGAVQNTLHMDARWVRLHQAGFIPNLHVSAYYGLVHAGRVAPSKVVLLQLGAGPEGLAALDISLLMDAEVFATVDEPGAEQQRSVLLSKGLAEDRILNATSESLVEIIMCKTNGKGVDIVYSPTDAYHEVDIQCVRPCGTVVHIASFSDSKTRYRALPNSITVVKLNLRQLLEEDPAFVSELFHKVALLVSKTSLTMAEFNEARRNFDLSDLSAARMHLEESPNLRYAMVSARRSGECGIHTTPRYSGQQLNCSLDPNGTYVLAGGLGGLGRSISALLVRFGVRYIAILTRSQTAVEKSEIWITQMRKRGVSLHVYSVDICDADDVNQVVGKISGGMPPIRGVFQCAAVIKDAIFDNMTWSDWQMAFRPKTLGTQNLVESMGAAAHDAFFIFLASSSGVIGNRGQANYAAGNCFLDAMARKLQSQGKHAVSIDLGPVLGAGMLEGDDATLDMLRANGFYGIRHADFLRIVTHAITSEISPGIPMPPQVVLGVGTGGIFHQNKPADPYWFRTAIYSYMRLVDMPPPDLASQNGPSSQAQDIRTQLTCSTNVLAAAKVVKTGLVRLLAKSMTMLPEEIDEGKSPAAYGIDSLVAVGIRNWVLANCVVQMSVFEVLGDQSVTEMAMMIAQRGGYGEQARVHHPPNDSKGK
ncbi:Polyketide synthase [Paramyrothecium foliicola]|nr:Polyketide synthase [Paramyrothecium foliicola]